MDRALIVGAGPVGLMLACELDRHGIHPRIIDQNDAPSTHSKALGVHARTLEIWGQMGIAHTALAAGRTLHGMNAYADGKRIAHIPFDDIDSPFPFILCRPQSETERILLDVLARRGIDVERRARLTALSQTPDYVEATLGDERVRTRWLIGCDGAHSTVRYDGTDPATRIATLRHPIARELRNRLGAVLASLDVVQRTMLKNASEIGVNYRHSPIVGERGASRFAPGPRAGDRAPDAPLDESRRVFDLLPGTAHVLLLFGDDPARLTSIAARAGERLPITPAIMPRQPELYARYGVEDEGLYLIRPDGYIGFRARAAVGDALLAHLDKILGR